MTTTAEHRHLCHQCGQAQLVADLNFANYGGPEIWIDCKDRDACRLRTRARAEATPTEDGHDANCESEFVGGPTGWSPCECGQRAEEQAEVAR